MTNITKHYEINLRPVENYFFGGERTFGQGDTANYSAKSNPFPQQTALLGLLRYIILEQSKSLPLSDNKEKAAKLIGKNSFKVDINNTEKEQSFGIIKSISSMLLKKGDTYYRIGDEKECGDEKEKGDEKKSLKVSFDTDDQYMIQGNLNKLPTVLGFDPKHTYQSKAINLSNATNNKDNINIHDDVLTEENHIGIKKAKAGEDNKDSFFKQQCYSMKEDFFFSFVAEIKKDETENFTLEEGKSIITFGAEQKQFYLDIKELTDKKSKARNASTNQSDSATKLILISDTLVNKDFYSHCEYAISDTVSFRTLSYNHFSGTNRTKPTKLNLLQKGSILYPKDGKMDALTKYIESQKAFRNIGFNHYIKA